MAKHRAVETVTYIAPYLKAFISFAAAVLTGLATRFVSNQEPLPQNLKEWGVAVLLCALTTWLVWQTPNFPTVAQAEKKLNVAQNRVADGKQVK